METDFEIFSSITAYGGRLNQEAINKLKKWTEKNCSEFSRWNVIYEQDSKFANHMIIITLEKSAGGDISDYINSLIPFLKKCAKYCFYVNDLAPYTKSWGDWESGAFHISSDKKIAKIVAVSNSGDVRNEEIEW